MDKKLENKLVDEFPAFFKDMYGDPTKTCLAFGCVCGNGWWDIIYEACKKISKIDDGTFYFIQIKEKFGCLRLYYSGGVEGVGGIIQVAENESCKACENCGTKDDVTIEGEWVQTLCKKCRNFTN